MTDLADAKAKRSSGLGAKVSDTGFCLVRKPLPFRWLAIGVLSVWTFWPLVVSAQSLGDLAAKTAAEREKRAKEGVTTTKTYSNKDLETMGASGGTGVVAPQVTAAAAVVANAPKGSIRATVVDGPYTAGMDARNATAAGVDFIQFSALIHVFKIALAAAKEHESLSAAEDALLRVLGLAETDYEASATFWELKTKASSPTWKGEIPILFPVSGQQPDTSLVTLASAYGISVNDRLTSPPMGVSPQRYKAIPGNAIQIIWEKAAATLNVAADMYGRAVSGSDDGPTCSRPAAAPSSATAVCKDESLSSSQNRSGTCSDHQGVRCWICPGPLCR